MDDKIRIGEFPLNLIDFSKISDSVCLGTITLVGHKYNGYIGKWVIDWDAPWSAKIIDDPDIQCVLIENSKWTFKGKLRRTGFVTPDVYKLYNTGYAPDPDCCIDKTIEIKEV